MYNLRELKTDIKFSRIVYHVGLSS